jgi:hypothetical protein
MKKVTEQKSESENYIPLPFEDNADKVLDLLRERLRLKNIIKHCFSPVNEIKRLAEINNELKVLTNNQLTPINQ